MSLRIESQRSADYVLPLSYKPEARIIPIIARAPQSWIHDSLPQIIARIPPIDTSNRKAPDHHDLAVEAEKIAEARWKEKSGFDADKSSFALVIPIHNEGRSLEGFLESLKAVNIPGSVNAEIILATNACVDQSEEIVKKFLKGIRDVVEVEVLPKIEGDPQLDPFALSVKEGNVKFSYISTEKPGKASMLTTANEILLKGKFFDQVGPKVLMVSDSDAYMEPDALAILYGDAKRHFEDPEKNGVLVWGNYKLSKRPNDGLDIRKVLGPILGFRQGIIQKHPNKFSATGCLFALDADWVEEVGGVPKVAIEDLALSYVAAVNGREIHDSEQAFTHVYGPNNVKEFLSANIRYARGALQIREMGESYAKLMDRRDPGYSGTFYERVYRRGLAVLQGRRSPLREVYEITLKEYFLRKAQQELNDVSNNSETWEAIKSTK